MVNNTNIETINHDINQTLVVQRYGEIDSEYYDAEQAARRKEALKEAGHLAIGAMAHGVVRLGRGIVWLMTPDELRINRDQASAL